MQNNSKKRKMFDDQLKEINEEQIKINQNNVETNTKNFPGENKRILFFLL